MNYWLIIDTHFNHTKLEDWGARSGDWQKELWDGITKIPQGDVLIHLGDICIGNDEILNFLLNQYADQYGFKTILIRGNHDKKGIQWYTAHGWDFVCDGLELIYQGHYLHFTHRPARYNNQNSYNIHGHTHGNLHRSEEYLEYYDKNYHIDISPELMGFKPIRLDTLLKMKNRPYPVYGGER